MVRRTLAIATVVSIFIILFGPWNVGVATVLKRSAVYLVYGWSGALLGLVCARLVGQTKVWDLGVFAAGPATGLAMMPFQAVVVILGVTVANGHPPPIEAVPTILWDTALICVGASLVAVLIARRNIAAIAAAPAPPKFLERLPLKLRGAEVWAIEAEDHYLRLHTSKGQDLILMRLADAVAELEGIEGAQVHRSWWVAREAITDAKRGDGRATLTLKDGAEVPVSRTYAGLLRERGWI
jgi:DNA-binding LytR/AlgR family response regulator